MIRQATIKDIPHLLEIEKRSFLPCDRFTRKQFIYAIEKGRGILLVWSFNPDIVKGYIYVLKTGRIYSLAVHPQYRNHKVAHDLLKVAELIFSYYPKLTLEVRKDNKAAQCFYSKSGYIYDGIRDNYYSDGMDAIIMKKDLFNAERRLAETGNTL